MVLAAAGVALFSVFFERGLRANLDTSLASRADATAAETVDYGAGDPSPPKVSVGRRPASELRTLTAVYDSSGSLVSAQPTVLPAQPLTVQQRQQPVIDRSIRTVGYAGDTFRMVIEPVRRSDGVWQVVVADNLDGVDDATAQVRHVLYIAAPVVVVLVTIGAWLVSGAALRPVDRMRADAETLGLHDPGGRITEPPTRDSLNRLAHTFNALLDRLRAALEQQRGLVADAGHELRTPLAVLQTELETAVRPNRTREDLVESIQYAREEVNRLVALSNDLLFLAEADGGHTLVHRQRTSVSDIARDLDRAFRQEAEQRQITVEWAHRGSDTADLDPSAVRRILFNLLANALRHTPPHGRVTLTTVTTQPAPGASAGAESGSAEFTVSDSGPGFPPEFLPYAFDRFARADKGRTRASTSGGSGLGLAIVAALAVAHGGSVVATNNVEGGATVRVVVTTG